MKINDIAVTPKSVKDFFADYFHYKRIAPVKRIRKRQIKRAKWMIAWHDHTCVEWSQWWHEMARKPKRWSA